MNMAIVSTYDYNASVSARADGTTVRVDFGEISNYLRLNTAEAVKLRDDLSRAITEAATAAAKAKAVEVAA
jgi:hypothetical protein